MAEENIRERDMVLSPNEYMYVQDETKGHVDIFIGPTKQSLSNSDKPVVFDDKTKRFIKVDDYRRATQIEKIAPEGWYIVLKNPSKDGKHPFGQGKGSTAELEQGRKVNIPGPCHFALWPGQMAKVIKGHHLRSNQYLLVRVYDADAARHNWKNAVVQPAGLLETSSSASGVAPSDPAKIESGKDPKVLGASGELTMGQTLIIKGTDVSFYIPPTGVEVVPDDDGKLVRNAVTLARLEYCLLFNESGRKRYEQGEAVVFPEPTEIFVEREADDGKGVKVKTRKFRAIELNESSGIYVKVIADYKDELTGKDHKTGDELFITGKDTMIYFPREEHAIIKYGSSEVHYGIAIPAGEARYVLNRNSGAIKKVVGETVFLPDPRSEVIVRRILDFKTCNLLFPNNLAAFQHNAGLCGVDLETYMQDHPQSVANIGLMAAAATGVMGATGPQGPMGSRGFAGPAGVSHQGAAYSVVTNALVVGDSLEARGLESPAGRHMVGDQFQRKNTFTAPRMITLDSKFDGVISTDIWTGYAMLLVRKSGERKIVRGPKTILLEYDESPQVLTLSCGKPKTTDNLLRTAFLKTDSNIISDIIDAQTSDFIDVSVKVSYRVNFEGDEQRWFNVENYVKFLCDHMRSKIRNAVHKLGVEKFIAESTDILRDVILGSSRELPKNVEGESPARPGTLFKENGMRIYDVEILDVKMKNPEIEKLIVESQRETIKGALTLAAEKRKLGYTRESESVKQETFDVQAETRLKQMQIEMQEATRKLERDLVCIDAEAKASSERNVKELDGAKAKALVQQVTLDQQTKAKQTEIGLDKEVQAVKLAALEAEIRAAVEKGKAFTPDLIAALTSFGDKELIERLSKSMSPLAILGGESVQDVMSKLLSGTKLAEHLLPSKNGSSSSGARA
jgi:major vault protein